MSKFRLRNLERHRVGGTGDKMELSLPRPTSPSGKVYQYSPNPEAAPRLFLIGDAPEERQVDPAQKARILREPGPGQTVCPYSGFIADDSEFTHLDDIEAVKEYAIWLAKNDVHDMIADMARGFNRGQKRGGLISMSMEVKGPKPTKPLAIREDLLRSLTCSVCQREYGVYALALFCPDCGAPNVSLHFVREIELVGEQVTLADELGGAGRGEIAYRLMGNAHEDVLTAFEATQKSVYQHLVRSHLPDQVEKLLKASAIRNAFQNVERSREKYAKLDIDPFAALDDVALETLRLNIQKRHVLGHNLGMADERYAEFAPDHEPGATITLVGQDIRGFAAICSDVVSRLDDALLG